MSGARAVAAAGAALIALATLACDGDPPPPKRPPGLLLDLDGLHIGIADVERFYPYFDSVDRRLGRNTRVAAILENHAIPLAMARRAWPAERAAARQLCEGLRRAIDNGGYPALVSKGKHLRGAMGPRKFARSDLPLPIRAFLFDDANLGQVSPVLELPEGFCLAAAFDITRAGTRPADRVEAIVVSFPAVEGEKWVTWFERSRAEVASKVLYLHPDYQEGLPPWLERP